MTIELTDAVAAVTGGASGIGRALALSLARAGADVIVTDVDEEGAARVAAEVETSGRRSLSFRVDVSDRTAVEDLVDRAVDWQGHCDVFCSNAGVGVSGAPERVPIADWEWVMGINLWPHVWAVRSVLPHMLERGSGHLVHVASSAGVVGFPTLIPYVVSKHGVVGLAESVAAYVHGRGVGVSVVCPLGVATDISRSMRITPEDPDADVEELRAFGHEMLQQAGIPPEDVAEATLEAMGSGSLYVFPSPELWDIVRAKWEDPDAWLPNWAQATRVGPGAEG